MLSPFAGLVILGMMLCGRYCTAQPVSGEPQPYGSYGEKPGAVQQLHLLRLCLGVGCVKNCAPCGWEWLFSLLGSVMLLMSLPLPPPSSWCSLRCLQCALCSTWSKSLFPSIFGYLFIARQCRSAWSRGLVGSMLT